MRKLNKIVKSFTTRENFSGDDSFDCGDGECTFEGVDVEFEVPSDEIPSQPNESTSEYYTKNDDDDYEKYTNGVYTAEDVSGYIADVSGYIDAMNTATNNAVRAAVKATRQKIAREVNNKVDDLVVDKLTSLKTAYQRHNKTFSGFRGDDNNVNKLIEDLNNFIEITTTEMRDLRNYIKDLQAVNKSGEHYSE